MSPRAFLLDQGLRDWRIGKRMAAGAGGVCCAWEGKASAAVTPPDLPLFAA